MKNEAGAAGTGGYASVNDLEVYYEIHGDGRPLVLLHGAYMTIDAMGEVVPELAGTRQVIAVELQGQGRTADVDRPLSYERMADDTAALLRHLGIDQADVFGFSMGGSVALQIALRHPEVVRKLVVASASYTSDGMQPELHEMIPSITPEAFAGSPIEEEYLRTAPNPEDFPALVAKLKRLDMEPFAWPPEDMRGSRRLPCSSSGIPTPSVSSMQWRCFGCSVAARWVTSRASRSPSSRCSQAPRTSSHPAAGSSTAPVGSYP